MMNKCQQIVKVIALFCHVGRAVIIFLRSVKSAVVAFIKFSKRIIIKRRYPNVLNEVRKLSKQQKIKVLFLVCELSKWKAQSLYDLMKESADFEPVVALTDLEYYYGMTKVEKLQTIKNNFTFFFEKGMNCVYAYDFIKNEPIKLSTFNPQIVFYQQPWHISTLNNIDNVSKYALTCYIPYFVPNYGLLAQDCGLEFHKRLFRFYVLNKELETVYNKYLSTVNQQTIKGCGHTMLDAFYLQKSPCEPKNYVIYAPHWSIYDKNNINSEYYSTFTQNYTIILDYAKKHPEFNWVFKPHPRLKSTLKQIGYMTEDEIEKYYSDWEKIGQFCNSPDYINLFINSKALITDCGSFLIEYFCTTKPIVHLLSSHTKLIPPQPVKDILNTFYSIKDFTTIEKILDNLLIDNNDYKKEERMKILKKSGLLGNYAAANILADLRQVISDGT